MREEEESRLTPSFWSKLQKKNDGALAEMWDWQS